MDKTDRLIAYVRANYDEGAHWVFETHDRADYEAALAYCNGSLAAAKAYLRGRWQATEERCREVQAEIF